MKILTSLPQAMTFAFCFCGRLRLLVPSSRLSKAVIALNNNKAVAAFSTALLLPASSLVSSLSKRSTNTIRAMTTDSSSNSMGAPSSTQAVVVEFRQESDFPDDIQIALAAIRKACIVTRRVQTEMDRYSNSKEEVTQTKKDQSPVTIADYAAQAIILQELQKAFPNDIFLAEESSNGLEEDVECGATLIAKIQELTGISDGSKDALFNAIDIGQSYQRYQSEQKGDRTLPPDRFWCLDPIDGTKGFLRKGGQYCVALALLEHGVPTIGILACPNLLVEHSIDGDMDHSDGGSIFLACKGQGCYEIGLDDKTSPPHFQRLGHTKHAMLHEDPSKARFCVAVEQGFNDPEGITIAMGKVLHGRLDDKGEILHCTRMDSQVKYGVIARGDAEFYVRLPKNHKDNIWDVAAGVLCLEEVGGKVTDTGGNPLDFTCGAKLPTVGILGARTEELHASLIQAYARATESKT